MVFGKSLPPHCHSLPLGQIRGLTSEELIPSSLLAGRAFQVLSQQSIVILFPVLFSSFILAQVQAPFFNLLAHEFISLFFELTISHRLFCGKGNGVSQFFQRTDEHSD